MADDEFTERIASVRKRFAAKLISRIAKIDAGLPACVGENAGAALFTAHLELLDLCGNGPTLGFVATGQAARACEAILQQPCRDKRGLDKPELATLRKELVALRVVAQNDLRSNSPVPE
jgi:hypothetical protein